VHLHNHSCHWKAASIKYYECECVCILALITQHANQIFSVRYCIVTCGLPDSATFFHKCHDYQKKLPNIKCVLSTIFVWNISHSKKNSARYDHKFIYVFMYSAHYSCQILIKLAIFLIDFWKILKYQIAWSSVH